MALDESTKLYRIIGIEAFISLLMYKKERYVRPIDCWEDTFEGYMLHQLDTAAGREKVLERLYILSGRDKNATIRNISKLLRSRYACYGQCWSKKKDSDAMWRIYSYNNRAIQLVTTVGRIQELLKVSSWDKLETEIDNVKYDINDEKEALSKILVYNAKIDTAYFHKRPAFTHEDEVRVILNDFLKYESVDAFSTASIHKKVKLAKSKSDKDQILEALSMMSKDKDSFSVAPKEITLNIPSVSNYLEGIRVHPQAPAWYVDLVKKLCRNYRITFIGQSDLYRETV